MSTRHMYLLRNAQGEYLGQKCGRSYVRRGEMDKQTPFHTKSGASQRRNRLKKNLNEDWEIVTFALVEVPSDG